MKFSSDKPILVILTALVFLIPLSLMTPSSSAESGNISILSYSDFTDNIGYQHIIGEIQNNSTTTQSDIKIVATFYDSSNQFATSSYIYSEIQTLRPGEKSPFEITDLNRDHIPPIISYKLSTTSSAGASKPAELKLTLSKTFKDEPGHYHVTGEVLNQGNGTAKVLKVVSVFKDSNKKIVAVAFSQPMDLDAGKSQKFELVVSNIEASSRITTLTLNVDSREYSMINDELAVSNQIDTPSSSVGNFTITLSPISVTDMDGNILVGNNVTRNTIAIMSTTMKNNIGTAQPFVVVLEIRDKDQVTTYIQFQKGSLASNSQTEIGISWLPDNSGHFTIRAIILSQLKNPEILSNVEEKTIDSV
ncbi:MAG: hypothetical protein E6K92_04060 [Thaumarchaeota archaeon]|nr:MAG: hypothetical protein E6K92_04060 [Nitrososphaerota archaeon]